MVKRARGFETLINFAYQADDNTVPGSGWKRLPVNSYGYRARQDLLQDETLGTRDELDPQRGPIDVAGPAVVPLDLRAIGYWLKLAIGEPLTSQERATGKITFSGQPTANSTITLNGTAWTFVASGASGNQTNIGANLAATLTALATNLNASADAQVVKCTYTATATELLISFDAPGAGGNTFTLAASTSPASNGTVSGTVLTGGGWKHLFRTGGPRYRGKFTFSNQPANNATITIAGVTWTFVTSGATGTQTNIGAALADTLAQVAADLNASANATLALFTYANTATELFVELDDPDENTTATLSSSTSPNANATPNSSPAALTIAEDLPIACIEEAIPRAADPAFMVGKGIKCDSLSMDWQRPGMAAVNLGLMGFNETRFSSSQAVTPVKPTFTRFGRFQGSVKKGGVAARIVSATLELNNSAEGVPELRDDGLVGTVQTGKSRLSGTIQVRYATKAEFLDPSETGTPIDIQLGYRISDDQLLTWDLQRVHLSREGLPIEGSGGVQATHNWRAVKTGAAAGLVTLRNDVTSYADGA